MEDSSQDQTSHTYSSSASSSSTSSTTANDGTGANGLIQQAFTLPGLGVIIVLLAAGGYIILKVLLPLYNQKQRQKKQEWEKLAHALASDSEGEEDDDNEENDYEIVETDVEDPNRPGQKQHTIRLKFSKKLALAEWEDAQQAHEDMLVSYGVIEREEVDENALTPFEECTKDQQKELGTALLNRAVCFYPYFVWYTREQTPMLLSAKRENALSDAKYADHLEMNKRLEEELRFIKEEADHYKLNWGTEIFQQAQQIYSNKLQKKARERFEQHMKLTKSRQVIADQKSKELEEKKGKEEFERKQKLADAMFQQLMQEESNKSQARKRK